MTPENPQVPKIPDELVEKARVSVRKSWEVIGRPALERFEAQKGRDVKVNEHWEERILLEQQTERIRKSVEQGVERVVKPFLRRVERHQRIPNSPRRYRTAF